MSDRNDLPPVPPAALLRIADAVERIARALEEQSAGAVAFAEAMRADLTDTTDEERPPWETRTPR